MLKKAKLALAEMGNSKANNLRRGVVMAAYDALNGHDKAVISACVASLGKSLPSRVHAGRETLLEIIAAVGMLLEDCGNGISEAKKK